MIDKNIVIEKVDIVDHTSRFETLNSEGDRFVGSHSKHGSQGGRCFHVYPNTQSWHCFNCGKGGSIFDYEMDRLEISFTDALLTLCQKYSLSNAKLTQDQISQFNHDHSVRKIIHSAFLYYHNSMSEANRDYYRKRGLSDRTIDENLLGYASDGNALARHLKGKHSIDELSATGLFFKNADGSIGDRYTNRYVMPYWYRSQIVYSIGRSVDPKIEARKKYVKHLTNSKRFPYVSKVAVKHVLLFEDLIKHQRILVTEGVIDAYLARQAFGDKVSVISPVTTKMTSKQVDKIATLAIEKKATELIFVNDNENGKAGETGALSTASKIEKIWQEMKVDEKKGKKPIEIRLPQLRIATLRKPPEVAKIDLADYLAEGKADEAYYWIDSAPTLWAFKARLADNPIRFFTNKGREFVPKWLADELQERNFYKFTSDQLYRYQSGVYLPSDHVAPATIQKKLKAKSRKARIDETLRFIEVQNHEPIENFNPDDSLINVKNGLYNITTDQLQSHSPARLTTCQIPITYDPKAECPKIDQFLSEVLPPDSIDLICEMIGYCLLQRSEYERAFMLIGKGANGKSTLLKLLSAFLGKENVSSVSLQDLSEHRFKRAELFGKLANTFADLDARSLRTTTYFKMITSGDMIDAERKFQNPFSFNPFATLIFSANEIPLADDRSDAYYRRLIILPFPNSFEGEDLIPDRISDLIDPSELSGLFNKAIDGIVRLYGQNSFSENEATTDAMTRYQRENDSVKQFLLVHCEEQPKAETGRTELYDRYELFCEAKQCNAEKQHKFNTQLLKIFPTVEKARSSGKDRRSIWLNLRTE